MNQAITHMIRREVFELSTGHSKNGLECQQRASGMVHAIIHPILESCFDQMELGKRRLVIDKLEIDLGVFDAKNLEKELMNRLRDMLEKELSTCLQKAREAKTTNARLMITDGAHLVTTTAAGSTTMAGLQQSAASNAQLLDAEETFYILLYWFLQHGRLPWWLEPMQQQAPINELFDIQFINKLQEEEKGAFRELLRSSPAAGIRLVNHFSTEWMVQFLQHIDIPVSKTVAQFQIILPVLKAFTTVQKLFHQHFWLEAISSGSVNITLVIEKTTRGYNDTGVALARALHQTCKERPETVWAAWSEQIEKYLAHQQPYDDFRKQTLAEQPPVHTPHQQPLPAAANEVTEEEGLFVSAAGLVILHPFLTELFTSTGLWNNHQWQDENSSFRAVQLLSQLAYGQTDLPEYQLTFIKILLGMDIETPLPAQEPLNDAETTACIDLLQALISHWTALRNTGAAAVQEAFLQRHGKLNHHKKEYHVTVEHLAQDVLLSRLPWGIGMIKLPWMQNMLHVNWL
jgi:hypothetical protein